MLELSDESKRLVSTFLAYRNDVDIYTEDELKDKEFYTILFNRLLQDDLRISDITPLGSRKNVIARCQQEPDNGRKKIFIIDGDVTIIHGKDVPNLKNLYVLQGYCIENFVVDKESVINFLYSQCATKPKKEIEDSLKFDEWLGSYSSKLIDLFIHYSLVDFFGGSFKLANVNKFHNKGCYCTDLLDNDLVLLKEDILKLTTNEAYTAKYVELKTKWSDSLQSLLTIVSGKDYLIPIILIKMHEFKASRALPTTVEAKFLLAHHCSLERLADLKKAILEL